MAKRTVLIATLPKSGTWYSHNFFWCYEQLLQHKHAYLKGNFEPNLLKALTDKAIPNPSTHRATLGIEKLFICHAICPGFLTTINSRRRQWDALHFPLPYNWGEELIREHGCQDRLNPAENADARIVYLYRNPLDHFVSYYRHTQSHVDVNHRLKTLPDGSRLPIKDLKDFVFAAGMLGAFIKHYYTYRQMQSLYPGQVLLKSYEDLTANPLETFAEILTFIDAAPQNMLEERLFRNALSMSSKESLMAIESRLTRSMASDQMGNEKHIRGGEVGKWCERFTQEDLEKIESAFNLFDMTLTDFRLTDTKPAHPAILNLATLQPAIRQAHQIAFLEHQHNVTDYHVPINNTEAPSWLKTGKTWIIGLLRRSFLAGPLRAVKRCVGSLLHPHASCETKISYTYKKI